MANVMQVLPELQGQEQMLVGGLLGGMTDAQAQMFAAGYREQRKDPNTILILAILGFVGAAGIHRFMLGQIGMGLLYLFTGGLCWIGTIIDLVNHKAMTFEYNSKIARQLAGTVRAAGGAC